MNCTCDWDPPTVYRRAEHIAGTPHVCSECGAPIGPRSMVEKLRQRVKSVRSDLCIACKARSWNRSF